ncbi:helix-turn-helix domain-containing protein [Terrimonas pollutisoli]|uniref:helix-turn-helix domain-containing protein n=1 Tax=Terrimonas pollutisoli TaxID=3034147 RepID=UPI0023EBE658|nr:helix-turn-helix domain-containing protein [Terrimonas sp. H1YJ31]
MVSATEIKPAVILQPYVRCYALRVFNTGESVLQKPLHALNECYMTFFLKDKFCYSIEENGRKKKVSDNVYFLSTQSAGCGYFKGDFILFNIEFKANGFFAVFGIPQKILMNTFLRAEDIFGNDYSVMREQLESSQDIAELGMYMDTYLVTKLLAQKHKHYTPVIANVANNILKNNGLASIDSLALYANMSLRNFERRFINEVGMPPKLFMRITRFYTALQDKMIDPQKSWTSICYNRGYFDQAHLIKEFREFTSKAPEELFRITPLLKESFSEKVEL